jgi:hypothetical protein
MDAWQLAALDEPEHGPHMNGKQVRHLASLEEAIRAQCPASKA